MIHNPTQPTALDIDEIHVKGCACVLKPHLAVFPICGKAFNPDHPIREHRGAACGNKLDDTGINLCGHAQVCHDVPLESPTL